MKKLYKIPSGKFAGWLNETTNRLYDKDGNNVGFLKGDIAYSLDGYYLAEITMNDYIGKNTTKNYSPQSPLAPVANIALAPSVDRVGILIAGWEEADF